jgi:serine/threonine protein kinase
MGTESRIADWVIEGQLGRGGMATVFRCRSAIAPRLRGALKLVHAGSHESTRERFIREIDALARLRHHGVVRVLAAGETKRGALYMVMELIEGENLLQRLRRGRVPCDEALRAIQIVADGLRHAHSHGIHHRDLKPANVMLTTDGGACLVDFGIALDLEHSRLTRAGTVPGTVTYMAPELLSVDGANIEPAPSDVYSLGQVLCEALSGQRCFESPRGSHGLVQMVRDKHAKSALDPGPDLPDVVRDLVRWATDQSPKARPTMAQLVRLLDGALSPDQQEIDAMEVSTRVTRVEPLFSDSVKQVPFEVTEEVPDDEEMKSTLAMRIAHQVEETMRVGIGMELTEADPLEEISLAEPTHPENRIAEDEEQVQAFDSIDIFKELERQRRGVLRRRVVLVMAGALGVLGLGMFVATALLVYYYFW